jgi:hypothetical protein
MRKASRKPAARTRKTDPSPEQIRRYMQLMSDQHQLEWGAELRSQAPHWVYLIGLHLRMVELDRMEEAVQELL